MTSAKLVVLTAWAARLVTALSGVVALRILSVNLEPPDYAAYAVLVGLIGWYALADLGIGYSTQNAVTRASVTATGVDAPIRLSALLVSAAGVLLMVILFFISSEAGPWLLGRLGSAESGEAATLFMRAGLIFGATALGSVAYKILYGLHRGHMSNLASGLASILGLLCLQLGIAHASDKVLFAISAFYGPGALISCIVYAWLLMRSAPSDRRQALRMADVRDLIGGARGFLAFAVVAAAVMQIDYIVMSRKVDAPGIVAYFTAAKFFGLITFLNQAVLFALWPTFTEHYLRAEAAVLGRKMRMLVAGGIAYTVVCTGLMLVAAPWIGRVLGGRDGLPLDRVLVLLFGVLALCRNVTDVYAIFLQSIGRLRPLIAFAAIQAVIGAALQWTLADSEGVNGILVGLIASFALTVLWGLPWFASTVLRTLAKAPSAAGVPSHQPA